MSKYLINWIGKLVLAAAAVTTAGTAASAELASKPTPAELAPRAADAQINDLAVAGDRLIGVGERGIILTTQDGEHWTQVPSPVDAMLNAVYFVDDRHGWAVGHDASIIHTADGGKSWSVQTYGGSGGGNPFMDVLFTDVSRGYAIGAYGLFKVTEDGGRTWTDLSDPVLTERGLHMNALQRLDDGTFVLVGEMGLVATSPDGRTWKALDAPYEGSLYAALPIGRGLLVIGMRGNALETENLSEPQWQAVPTGTEKSLFGVSRLGNGRLAVAGSGGTLMLLEPGKEPSRLIPPAADSGLKAATTYGALLAWKGQLYAATDHGVHRITALR